MSKNKKTSNESIRKSTWSSFVSKYKNIRNKKVKFKTNSNKYDE